MNKQTLGHIGVLMGGTSSEREISLKSGRAIAKALRARGCKVSSLDITTDSEDEVMALLRVSRLDVAFIALHGAFGEDGILQGILEKMGIAYTGSDSKASQLVMHKGATQQLLKQKGILVPEYGIVHKGQHGAVREIVKTCGGLPLVVKPISEGSSFGITIVRAGALEEALELAFSYGDDVLIEQYIEGEEVTAGILGEEVLPLVAIRPKNEYFDFDAKYKKGQTEYLVPAPLPEDLTNRVKTAAAEAFTILGCRDFARVDFICREGIPYLLEVNTIPGFTATSLLPMAAEEAGYAFDELCLKIVAYAVTRCALSAERIR